MPAGTGDNGPDIALGGSNQETTWGSGSDKLPPKPEPIGQEGKGKKNIIGEALNSLRYFFGRRR